MKSHTHLPVRQAGCLAALAAHSHNEKENKLKEVTPLEVKKMVDEGTEIQIIDVREPLEFDLVNIGGLNIPLKNIESQIALIQRHIPVIVHCKSGGRSVLAIAKLQQHGFSNLLNMSGGILRWIDDVDQELMRY